MNKALIAAIRIMVVVLAVVFLAAFVYVYSGKQVEAYFVPTSDEIFTASMDIDRVLLMSNGNVLSIGTFYQMDDISQNPCVFIKTYGEDCLFKNECSIDIPDGYSMSAVDTDGDFALVTLLPKDAKSGKAIIYSINSEGDIAETLRTNISNDDNANIDFYPCLKNGKIYCAYVRNSQQISFISGERTFFTTDISLDISVVSVSYVNDNIFICGTKENGTYEAAYFEMRDTGGNIVSSFASKDECNSIFCKAYMQTGSGNSGVTYIIGAFFNVTGFSGDTAKTSMKSQTERYGTVLVSSNYKANPWSAFFIATVNQSGGIETLVAPFNVSQTFGITELSPVFKSDSTDMPVAIAVSRYAEDTLAESYTLNVYGVGKGGNAGKSVDVVMLPYEKAYVMMTGEGEIYCYSGIKTEEGISKYCLKKYESLEDFAKTKKTLNVYQQIIDYTKNALTAEMLYVIGVFVVLYATIRISEARRQNK